MYLGIVKKVTNGMSGTNVRLLTKRASSKEEIKQWKEHYPNCQSIIIPYEESVEEDMEDFFDEFEDYSVRTIVQKEEAQRLYQRVMQS